MPVPPYAPTLTDGVVTLRGHREDDTDAVVAQCNDPESIRWTTVPVPYERHHAQEWIRSRRTEWDLGRYLGFAVETDGRFCGSVDLRPDGQGAAALGYGLGPWARGRGLLDRSLRLLLPWGFGAARARRRALGGHRGQLAQSARRLACRVPGRGHPAELAAAARGTLRRLGGLAAAR